jgi:glucuronokinase
MTDVRARAPARVALAGNPSDGYGGATLALAIANFAAEVTVRDADRLEIVSGSLGRTSFASLGELVSEVRTTGYGEAPRLLRATLVRFADAARAHGVDLGDASFGIGYRTTVPADVGLAGSSAIVTAALVALCARFGVRIGPTEMPELGLAVEVEELGIAAGLQDRVAQVHGGLTHMDFAPELVKREGRPRYERLDPAMLPPLFVAWETEAGQPSDVVHSDLRRRFEAGESGVTEAMSYLADLAAEARRAVVARDTDALGEAMDRSFEARRSVMRLNPRHVRAVQLARVHGSAANYAGSGGAIVGLYRSASRFEKLGHAFAREGLRIERCGPAPGAAVVATDA